MAFALSLESLVRQLLEKGGIETVALERRTKTVDSFKGKAGREDKNYVTPMAEITDLAGLRVITYDLADIERATDLISKSFVVDAANSVDKRQSIEADRFGYVSVHFVVSLDGNRAALPEYQSFAGLKAEIQVRTALQHAWAAIDHKLRYKNKEEIPAPLRRQLYRISALLETADEQFESLSRRLEDVRREYSEAVTKGSLDLPLDVDSLAAFIESGEVPKSLMDDALLLDIVFAPHHPNAALPEFSHLLSLLDQSDVADVGEFAKVLETQHHALTQVVRDVLQNWQEKVANPELRLVVTKDSFFRMIYLFAIAPEEAVNLAVAQSFGPKLGEAIEAVHRSMHNVQGFKVGP